ncbi:epimerase [Acidovorax sp. SRB_14]|uniref:NAD-dependent epimerase/dehydratase family protein n=1 Tax=Acidovorax sp. SRB_14 TaxID=1962699 RepID=UPI0015671A5A|nr:NAD-dependent epimerase/dehydratase family protein [Acidovorax sp. SRB_14]NMM80469.1 epimerase [Acidovorax sp. SRB_14]
MRILLTGSTGFIGHTLQAALERAGHSVHGGVSPRRSTLQPGQVPTDFVHDTTAAAWLPRLAGMDAVVNAVGVLRDTRERPIDAVHRDAPIALFDACAEAGVQRIVQISALGIEGSSTRYAQTKLAAEAHLKGLAAQNRLRPAILRPSVVFGKGGDSSALFMNLARLPVALFPGAVLDARVQPVSVHDLAAAVVALLGPAMEQVGTIECTGPEPLTMGAFIASLRQQLGHPPAMVLRLSQPLTELSARLGDAVPQSPWCSETLAMLGSDNVGHPAVFERLLGRPGVHYSQLVATAWR